ncbi:MAG: hypothetical protein DWQ05_11610 [Calditrichaeota bacterium]|nr:MAG: hypothetical protein DWQ05_11610 [Calditrichota bacterium]
MPTLTQNKNIDNLISRQEQRLFLVRIQNNDVQVLQDLLRKTHGYFSNLVLRILGDKRNINEILIRAFTRFLDVRHRLDSHREFVPILGRIIFEEVALELKSVKKRRQNNTGSNEHYVRDLFRELALQQQLVLHFRIIGNMNYEDIASTLRLRVPVVISQIAESRHSYFNSLVKKRVFQIPGKISSTIQKILLAHPDFDELKQFAPKTYKIARKSEEMGKFISLAQKCDILLKNSLASESLPENYLENNQQKLLLVLHEHLEKGIPAQENATANPVVWGPVLRTIFAVVLVSTSLMVWEMNKPGHQSRIAQQAFQKATMPFLIDASDEMTATSADSEATVNPVKNANAETSPDSNKKTAANSTTGSPQQFEIQVRDIVEPKKPISGVMTISLPVSHSLNPYAATMRKQEMIDSISSKISLWENFFATTADSSLYFPHIIQHLAELYSQAAESSKDALVLADAVAWFEKYDHILISFFSDSVYTIKLDALRKGLQAARVGK